MPRAATVILVVTLSLSAEGLDCFTSALVDEECISDEGGDSVLHLLQYRSALTSHNLLASSFRASAAGINTGPWGFDISGMSPNVRPGDDFYRFAGGTWLSETSIPSDRTSWSSFSVLDEQVTNQLKGLLSEAPESSLLGKFYTSFVDQSKVNSLGASPLLPELHNIATLQDAKEFATYVGGTNFGFGSSPFAVFVSTDPKNPDWNVAQLSQSGLGLPDRSYYLEDKFADYKKAYGEYIVEILSMVNWTHAPAAGAQVLALEEGMARASWSRTQLRDPVKTYNKMTPADLPQKAPGFAWDAFMKAAGPIPENTTLIVSAFSAGDDSGVVGIAKVISEASISTLRAWAAFRLVSGSASALSQPFEDAHFDFFSKTLQGQKEQKPRWKKAISYVTRFLPDAIGKEYVSRHFPESAKKKMDELTALLKEAFALRLHKLTWMTDATKAKALTKLESFTFEVGGPKKYRAYENLALSGDDLYGNLGRILAWSWNWDLKQLNQPVDLDYWDMSPTEINAFFDPTKNRCVFLAAILQPPFFMPDGDASVNFGGIGAVIGHEMTHGFDDQGRQYDAHGKLDDWWTPADAEEFNKRARAYGAQFANFTEEMPAGMHINPELTMGENIADLGGLTIALDAYRMWLRRNSYAPEPPVLMEDGDPALEGDRRYFAGWEQVWRAKYTKGALQTRLISDPHSPGAARGTIPPQNLDAWYRAYGVVEGDALFLDEAQRVQIW